MSSGSSTGRPYRLETIREEGAFGIAGCEGSGTSVGLACLIVASEPPQQVGPGGVEQVVLVQVQVVEDASAAAGPWTSPIAMARLSATTGVGVIASSWS